MKSTAIRPIRQTKDAPLPKLMVSDDGSHIVLVTGIDAENMTATGTAVGGNRVHAQLGEYSENWAIEDFWDYDGTVTLEND